MKTKWVICHAKQINCQVPEEDAHLHFDPKNKHCRDCNHAGICKERCDEIQE